MNISTSIAIVAIVIGITSMGLVLYDDDDYTVSVTRDIHLFSQVDENIDEDKFGVPPDQYSTEQIIVNKGDTVNVHFYNLEPVETQEHHTFTLNGEPYDVNLDINAGESDTVSFVAKEFPFLFDRINHEKFIKNVISERDYLTHYIPNKKFQDLNNELLLSINQKLLLLIESCLLYEIGFTFNNIKKIMDNRQSR